MGLVDLIKDLASGHPGRALEDLPGGKALETTAGKLSWDLINATTNAPGGLIYAGSKAFTDPGGLIKEMAYQTIEDFKHPLRHPGYTLLDTIGFLPIPGAIAARGIRVAAAAERGALATRAGTVSERLAQAAQEGIIPEHLVSEQAAKAAGRTGEYDRLVNPHSGEINTAGKQMRDALLYPMPRTERILWPKGIESMDTFEGMGQHGWWYSRDPTIQAAQRLVDKAYDTLPEMAIAPIWRAATGKYSPLRSQEQRLTSAEKSRQKGVEKEAQGVGPALLAKHAEKMNPVNWMVLRLIGEGTDPAKRIAFHEGRLAGGHIKSPRMVAETENTIETIKQAAEFVQPKLVTTANGRERVVNELKPEYQADLGEFIDDFKNLSNERTEISKFVGALSEDSELARAAGPHALMESGDLPTNIKSLKRELAQIEKYKDNAHEMRATEIKARIAEYEGQLNFDALEIDHDSKVMRDYFDNEDDIREFVEKSGVFRIPYTIPKDLQIRDRPAYRKSYKASSRPVKPGSYTHQFKAGILKMGGGEQNVSRLIAESYTEAHRFVSLSKIWDRMQQMARETPDGIPEEYRQLIRLDKRYAEGADKLNLSQVERRLMDQAKTAGEAGGKINVKETVAAGRLFEGIRQHLFPEKKATAADLGLEDAEFAALKGDNQPFANGKVYGYGWIDRRMLGDLYKKNPLIGLYDYTAATKAIKTFDTVNQAVKSAMLFLRPAYALPNMLGNIALNMIHQGMLAPVHTGANLRLWNGLDSEYQKMIITRMGGGSEKAKFSMERRGNEQLLPKAVEAGTEWLGDFYSKFVDTPMRANAWMHEARMAGFETPPQIKSLLTDPKNEERRAGITNNALDEIINFDKMGPGEEAYMRRLILFYPFTRGASRYTANFPKEHPLATGVVGELGQRGTERSEEMLGPLPVWAEGLIPLGGLGIPGVHEGEVSNPAAFSIMGEPAHLAGQVLNLLTGHPNPDFALSQSLPPVYQGALAAVTGGGSARFAKPGTPLPQLFQQESFGGIPLISFYNAMRGRSGLGGPLETSVYPDDSTWHALSRILFGGALTPRKFDSDLANYRRYLEQPATYPSE